MSLGGVARALASRSVLWLVVAGAALLAGGCASLLGPTPKGALASVGETPRVWRLEGRIGVKVDDRGWSASLLWRQNGEDFSARFSGPFGQGAVEVHRLGGALWVRDQDGQELRGPELQRWALQQFGAELPVRELPYWLVGAADPGRPAEISRDDAGRPLRLMQAGWGVRFLDWTELGSWLVPRRLALSRRGVEVKVVVDQWAEVGDTPGRG